MKFCNRRKIWIQEKQKSNPTFCVCVIVGVCHTPCRTLMSNENRPAPLRDRLPSRIDLFEDNLKLDIRAHQRTYEGAYTRTAIGCFPFQF